MDALQSLNLRVDESEQLRVISAETDDGSRELSSKIGKLIREAEGLQERLSKMEKLLEALVNQGSRARTVGIAANIQKLTNTFT